MAVGLILALWIFQFATLGMRVNAQSTAVSLLSFGAPPISLPKLCNTQYDSIIPGCAVSDFQNGASCSDGCKAGLLQIQTNVNLACSNVKVPSNTLLGEVFSLQILAALCPNNPSTSTTAATAPTSSAPAVVTTAPTSAASASATASPSTSTSTTVESSTTTATSTASDPAALTSTTSRQSSSERSTTTSQQPQATKLSAQQQQIVALVNSGGGSPFDIIVNSAGGAQTTAAYAVVLVGLVSFVVLLAV